MTKAELQTVIAHAETQGNHELARVLRKGWSDVLDKPEAPAPRIEPSPINSLSDKFSWEYVRLEL